MYLKNCNSILRGKTESWLVSMKDDIKMIESIAIAVSCTCPLQKTTHNCPPVSLSGCKNLNHHSNTWVMKPSFTSPLRRTVVCSAQAQPLILTRGSGSRTPTGKEYTSSPGVSTEQNHTWMSRFLPFQIEFEQLFTRFYSSRLCADQ